MPYPNEHSARIKNPSNYKKFTRKNNNFGTGIHAIFGITNKGKAELQAIRFDKDKFSVAEAKEWLKEHDFKYIKFEPASKKKSNTKNVGNPVDEDKKDTADKVVSTPELGQSKKSRHYIEPDTRHLHMAKDARLISKALKSNDNDAGWVEGYAAVWNNVDHQNEIIRKGAFAKSIKEMIPTGKVKLMARHYAHGGDVLDLLGTVTKMDEDEYGLWFHADFAPIPKAQEMRTLVTNGDIQACSVGFGAGKYGFIQMETDEVLEWLECKIYEVTLTVHPANDLAMLVSAKSQDDFTLADMSCLKRVQTVLTSFDSFIGKSLTNFNSKEESEKFIVDGFGDIENLKSFSETVETLSKRLANLIENPQSVRPVVKERRNIVKKSLQTTRQLKLRLMELGITEDD